MIAGLSAAHLAAIEFPESLRRLYVARDRDPAGAAALATLGARAASAGVAVLPLDPRHGDFNEDLMAVGIMGLVVGVREQLAPEDRGLLT